MLQRVLHLPVVSSTCESLQRTYASTKEAHPLMASVCEVYERGVQGAGALALWSVEPVVRRLEPQCESSNAARGEGTGGDTAGGASRGAGTGTQHPQHSPQPFSPARSRVFA